MAIRRRRLWFGKEVKPGDNAREVMTARADAHAAKLAPTIKKLRATGATLQAIADGYGAESDESDKRFHVHSPISRWSVWGASQVLFGPTASVQLTQQRWEGTGEMLVRYCCR
jgi:hypothetical protein